MARLTVAICQFPVDSDIARNGRYVLRQMRTARERGADVAHFPEACLSGYAGSDFPSYEGFDWALLELTTRKVLALAAELEMWVVLGSTHRLTDGHKPHNSLYIIDASGTIVDRYDKRFCGGDEQQETGDLAHYTPGNHASVFTINGVRCGALICYDYRFPELYRDYRRRGVQMVFHSYHAAHMTPTTLADIRARVGDDVQHLNPGGTYPGITMPATMTAQAAANHVDQLPELVGAGELLGRVLHARRRRHNRTAASQPRWRAHLHCGHRSAALRLNRQMARPGDERRPAQRNPR